MESDEKIEDFTDVNLDDPNLTPEERERLINEINSRILMRRPGRRFVILRLDYAFSVIVPCLIAIYLNNLNLFAHIDIIAGFLLYAITGNVLNDMIDSRHPEQEPETVARIRGYHWKELATIGIITFIFGTMMFVRTVEEHPINGLWLTLTVAMVVIYCIKKDIPVINQILLGVSHVLFPYIIIKTDAGITPVFGTTEWIALITFFSFAYTGQIVHEVIDGDSITKLSPRGQQLVIIISSIITIILGIGTMIYLHDVYFFPFILIPIGSIYTFRKPTRSTKGVKDVGIILGNVIMFYFIVLIIRKMTVGV